LKQNLQSIGSRLFLVLFGVGIAVLIGVWAAPQLIPEANERQANTDLGTIQYTVGMGDLFINMPNKITEPDDPHRVLSEHSLAWDEDGFRFPVQQSDNYDIIAIGDSFTEASNVALPCLVPMIQLVQCQE